MNIIPSRKTVDIIKNVFANFNKMSESQQAKMLSIISSSVISDISISYFGNNFHTHKIKTIQTSDSNSAAEPIKNRSYISKHLDKQGLDRLSFIVRDVIHESVHHCQFLFFKSQKENVQNGYVEALRLNVMDNCKNINYNGVKHNLQIQCYLPPSNNFLNDYLYAAQPKEAQAYNITDKYYSALIDFMPDNYEVSMQMAIMKAHENTPAEINIACQRNGITAVHAQCAQMLLNLYKDTEFKIHKKIQDVYKNIIQAQLKNQKVDFLGLKELYAPTEDYIETHFQDFVNENERVDFGQLRNQWNLIVENFDKNALITRDSNAIQDQIIFGAQYKIGNKDYNEFLFSIGEKPFQELELDK